MTRDELILAAIPGLITELHYRGEEHAHAGSGGPAVSVWVAANELADVAQLPEEQQVDK